MTGKNRRVGFHSGKFETYNALVNNDLDISGNITVAGNMDVNGNFSFGDAIIDTVSITGNVQIGTFSTPLTITSANNYPFISSAKIATSEATTAELRAGYSRFRVDANVDVGTAANWGYGLTGLESQIKFYGGANTTSIYCWQASGLWAQLETDGVSKVQFEDGCVAAAVYANVGLLSAAAGNTTIANGAVACGVAINSNSAANVTATGGFYGLYVYHDQNTKHFTTAIMLESAFTTGIDIGTCTTGISVTGATNEAIVISGLAATNGISITNPATGILLTYSTSKTEGISMTVATGQTLTAGMSMSGAGTYTTGILLDATTYGTGISVGGAATVGMLLSGVYGAYGLQFSGTNPVAIFIGGTTTKGIDIDGATTGISIGNGTTNLLLDGSATTGISSTGAITTVIDITGACTRGVRIGTHDWGVGLSGLVLTVSDPLLQVAGRIAASNVTAGVYACDYKQLALTSATQNTDTSWFASWNELYITPTTTTNLTGSSHYAAVKAHIEGAVDATITSSTGVTASLWGSNIIPAGYTNNGVIAGCYVDGILHTSMGGSGRTSAFEIGSHLDPNQGDWQYGLYMPASTVTTGISINGATTGIQVTGTGAVAASKAITTAGWTISNANLTDGIGAIEADLTLTGLVAGSVAALSSWVNMASVTTGVNLVCAQTNGLWSGASGVLTNGTFIFGMRAQCLLQTNGGAVGATFYPFSIVNNTNVTTAMILCNDATSDLGEQATAVGAETMIPLFSDNEGIRYVKVYKHS